jgi:GNAT superfamily N-acetyltransferase
MKDEVLFRAFATGDEDELITMNAELFSGDTATLGVLPESHVQHTIESFFSNENLVDIYIFDYESETIGYAIVSWFWSNEFGGRSMLLDEILVKKEFRGQSIGSRFISFALDKYKDAAVFMLEVSPGNPKARKLYETIGFKELKTRHLYFVPEKVNY